MGLWKSMADERAQRKWPSWSAHIAWGAFLVLAGDLQTSLGWAFLGSIILGFAWELVYAVMASPHLPANRASVGDACAWVAGALLGALVAVTWSV